MKLGGGSQGGGMSVNVRLPRALLEWLDEEVVRLEASGEVSKATRSLVVRRTLQEAAKKAARGRKRGKAEG